MSVAVLIREIILNNPPLTHLILIYFSDVWVGDDSSGEIIYFINGPTSIIIYQITKSVRTEKISLLLFDHQIYLILKTREKLFISLKADVFQFLSWKRSAFNEVNNLSLVLLRRGRFGDQIIARKSFRSLHTLYFDKLLWRRRRSSVAHFLCKSAYLPLRVRI